MASYRLPAMALGRPGCLHSRYDRGESLRTRAVIPLNTGVHDACGKRRGTPSAAWPVRAHPAVSVPSPRVSLKPYDDDEENASTNEASSTVVAGVVVSQVGDAARVRRSAWKQRLEDAEPAAEVPG